MTVSNNASAQKCFNNKSSAYFNDVLKQDGHANTNTRASFLKQSQPLRKSNHWQNTLSFIAPNSWNSLTDSLKATKDLNT